MDNSILVALSDSMSSHAVIEYLGKLSLCPDNVVFTLLHVFRQPSSGEELMGRRYIEEQPARFRAVLEKAKKRLVENGFYEDSITIELAKDPYPTVADGIIDYFKKHHFTMVVIGRKRMSKAEEFVLGDVSVKLVRALEETAVMVVKTK